MCVCVCWCLSVHICMCVCCVADYKRGFGGQYGVEVDKQDQCALGYEHKENLAKHESQKGTEPPLNTTPCPHLPFPNPLLILTPKKEKEKLCPSHPPHPQQAIRPPPPLTVTPPPPPPLQHHPINMNRVDKITFCVSSPKLQKHFLSYGD